MWATAAQLPGLDLMDDLSTLIANRIQLTTDGHKADLYAVTGGSAATSTTQRWRTCYGNDRKAATGQRRRGIGPGQFNGTHLIRISRRPEVAKISISYAERNNLTIQMSMPIYSPDRLLLSEAANHASSPCTR